MKIKPKSIGFNGMAYVWEKDRLRIRELKKQMEELISWQKGRLKYMVTVSELAYVLKCGMPHASDILKGNRNLTPENEELLAAYLSAKAQKKSIGHVLQK
jgi:hypothetical protein